MNNRNKELCKTCKYRTRMSVLGWAGTNAVYACFYIARTGHMRNCDPKDCTKYEKGNWAKPKQIPF